MSRIGKLPIEFLESTQVNIDNGFITVKGSKGELRRELNDLVKVEIRENKIVLSIDDFEDKKKKAFWGLYRSLINNMVKGIEEGFEKKLEINGVGYSASLSGNILIVKAGYSHPVDFSLPEGILAQVEGNVITISGIDKQLVGEVAAQIRKIRKPEPYKGKGIKYIDEVIRRKEGKTAAKGE